MTHFSYAVPSVPHYLLPYVGIIAVGAGLLLAFYGDEVFKFMTSLIGVVLGAVIGYSYGIPHGTLLGIGLALIGAIIGGFLFYYIAEAAVALIIAFFAFTGVLYLLGFRGPAIYHLSSISTVDLIVGLVIAIIIFALAIRYFSDLVAVFTSVAGGFLIDYGLSYFKLGIIATAVALFVIIVGMSFQFTRIRRKKMPVTEGAQAESGAA